MTPRLQLGRAGASPSRGLLRPLMGVLLLLLGWGSAAPASAEGGIISIPRTGPISVNTGETLTIMDGGSVTNNAANGWGVVVQDGGSLIITGGSVSSSTGVVMFGGTLEMTGGSVSGSFGGIQAEGTVQISGGSISGGYYGVLVALGTATISGTASVSADRAVDVNGATLYISGGSVTHAQVEGNGTLYMSGGSVTSGVQIYSGTLSISGGSVTGGLNNIYGGTATVSGCSLAVANGVLTGTLADGTPINTSVSGPITLVGPTTPPTITLTGANPLTVECHTIFTDPGATAHDACGGSFPATVSGSVDANTPGSYTLTYTASAGSNPVTQTRTVNVVDTTPPVITLNGSSPMTVDCQIQGRFTDPGATANDACAGSFPATASGSVDVNTPGTYTLTYNATDGTNAATPVTRTVIVVPVADLSVTQSASPSPVVTGSNLTYTVVASNAGPQAAQGVTLTDVLPAGTSFASATATAGTLTTPKKGSAGTVTWNMATLASGPGVTLIVVVKASAKAGATLTNTASASSSSPLDPNPGSNSATVVTSVLARR